MEKPYILKPGELEEDLREVFKKHGFSATDAYDLAKEIVKSILLK
jgi:LDH2 family malate/lactate/ureidoglycolate dehydrogenase